MRFSNASDLAVYNANSRTDTFPALLPYADRGTLQGLFDRATDDDAQAEALINLSAIGYPNPLAKNN